MLFADRLRHLPKLGVGVSTEYGAAALPDALDLHATAEAGLADFLEIGVEVARGLDPAALAWIASGRPVTWHFLDYNLHDPGDLDHAWLDQTREGLRWARPAWICGDAGLWHIGPRDRGHMLLLPPILDAPTADQLAQGVIRLSRATGLEVLPENPPSPVYIGPLHLLDFYARVAQRADCGLLLDLAHLVIYQHASGHSLYDGFDGFPFDRVVEIHVAGGTRRAHEGYPWIDDDHGAEPLPETMELLAWALPKCANLRAIVVECERNPLPKARPFLEAVRASWT